MSELFAANEKIDYLTSRLQIMDCITRYCRGMDRLDPELALSAFHSDAVVDYGVFVGSREGFFEYFYELHTRYHASTNHMICNHLCEIDGDTAHAETYMAVANNNLQGTPFTLAGGRYIDRLERIDGRWAISVRKCIGEWDANPGMEMVEKLTEAMRNIGTVSRNRDDVSYQRPLRINEERLGVSVGL